MCKCTGRGGGWGERYVVQIEAILSLWLSRLYAHWKSSQTQGKCREKKITEETHPTASMNLLRPINITQVFEAGEGTDINFWIQAGVPGASLLDDLYKYFSFHHSHGDTMTVMDPKQMNVAAAVWAVVSYVVADMEEMLPRS